MKDLIILDELKNLLPPLSDSEYAKLEDNILHNGIISPLVVWNGILVDGHHRYEICNEHQIPYAVKSITFDSVDDAKLWIWQHQSGRRNLTPYHRAELALRFKDAYAAKAKKRQGRKAKNIHANDKFPGEATETREVLGKMASISSGMIQKAEFIQLNADDATKESLRKGEKGISISSEYNRLRFGESRTSKNVENMLQKNIPDLNSTPEELGKWIIEHYPVETQHEVARILVDHVLKHVTT